MELLAKPGSHRSYGNGDTNCYINSCINSSEKVKLTWSIHHIERFSKSEITIYNAKVSDMAGRKTNRRRGSQAITKRYHSAHKFPKTQIPNLPQTKVHCPWLKRTENRQGFYGWEVKKTSVSALLHFSWQHKTLNYFNKNYIF